jgi:hypothetical protein
MITTKLAGTLDPKLTGLVTIVAGVMVPRFIKSPIGQALGDGLISTGVLAELQSFGVLSGIGYPAPGSYTTTQTGANGYNPMAAKTVGAPIPGGRQIMKTTVGGVLNGIPKATLHQIGALFED